MFADVGDSFVEAFFLVVGDLVGDGDVGLGGDGRGELEGEGEKEREGGDGLCHFMDIICVPDSDYVILDPDNVLRAHVAVLLGDKVPLR